MSETTSAWGRAAYLGLRLHGNETPRDLLYRLLVDRGMPHTSEVMGALDDLGLTVVEAATLTDPAR